MADEKCRELLNTMERGIAEQMTALNICRKQIREITLQLEKQVLYIKEIRECMNKQEHTNEVSPPPSGMWKSEPVQVFPVNNDKSRIIPPNPEHMGKTIQELDATGEAPTTRMDLLTPEMDHAQSVARAFRKAHPQWMLESWKTGIQHLTYDDLSVDIYPENPLRMVIGVVRKETRRLWNSIEKLNRMQESMVFGYENGRMICTLYFMQDMDLQAVVAYGDGIIQNYFEIE